MAFLFKFTCLSAEKAGGSNFLHVGSTVAVNLAERAEWHIDRQWGNFRGESAIDEMAKEPRFLRRGLAEAMHAAIVNFPETEGDARNLSFMPSFFELTGYVFLQVRFQRGPSYGGECRKMRFRMLEIACAAAKDRMPHLTKVIGIAIDAPKFAGHHNSEDFALLNCEDWPDHVRDFYEDQNRELRFFKTDALKDSDERFRTSQTRRRLQPLILPCGTPDGIRPVKIRLSNATGRPT